MIAGPGKFLDAQGNEIELPPPGPVQNPIAQVVSLSMTRDVRFVKDQHGNTITFEEGPKGIQSFIVIQFPNGRVEELEVSMVDMRRLQAAAAGLTVVELEKLAAEGRKGTIERNKLPG